MSETTITLPFGPEFLMPVILLVAFLFVALPIWIMVPSSTPFRDWEEKLGFKELPNGVFFVLATLWLFLFGFMLIGLVVLLWRLWSYSEISAESTPSHFRFLLAQLVATTAVLGAVVTLPITLNRLRLQREAKETAEESLFNDKINAATTDLYARRQRTVGETSDAAFDKWEDDIARRIAAIDRLEGLVEERPDVAGRVSRLLSVYVRELSQKDEVAPEGPPDGITTSYMDQFWYPAKAARSDLEKAIQSIGKLGFLVSSDNSSKIEVDLREGNLQRVHLNRGNYDCAKMHYSHCQGMRGYRTSFNCAKFRFSKLQRAELVGSELRNADFRHAMLNGTNFRKAILDYADFSKADFEGTHLEGASCRGSKMYRPSVDETTNFSDADFTGAAFREMSNRSMLLFQSQWQSIYADGTVSVPTEQRPTHWCQEKLTISQFEQAWHNWQRSIGMDPDDPT